MRLLFLNQYFPPDPAPTGVLLAELAARLGAEGHMVEFVSAGENYRAGQKQGGRMRREVAALGRMLIAVLRAEQADVIVSASSPPCLLVIATLAAKWHRARSVHWAMDIYPELAVALGEVPQGALARGIGRAMAWCYRQVDRVVALDEDMAAHLRRCGVDPAVIRPWVFALVLDRLDRALASESAASAEPWTWIYSGNLGRAHEWEPLLAAQAIVESRDGDVRLLFQGGGPSVPVAKARAAELGLRRCEWRGYVEEADLPASLLRCGACAVTQKSAARGLLWPSKLALLLGLPRPIAFVGPVGGAVAGTLRALPHAGVFAASQAHEIAEWVLDHRSRTEAPQPALDARQHRTAALDDWAALIKSLAVQV